MKYIECCDDWWLEPDDFDFLKKYGFEKEEYDEEKDYKLFPEISFRRLYTGNLDFGFRVVKYRAGLITLYIVMDVDHFKIFFTCGNEHLWEQRDIKLPHFDSVVNYFDHSHKECYYSNLLSIDKIPAADWKELYENCLAYTKEYEEFVAKNNFPSESEIFKALTQIKKVRLKEYAEVKKLINENSSTLVLATLKLPKSDSLRIHTSALKKKSHIQKNQIKKKAHNLYYTLASCALMKNLENDLKPSDEYITIKSFIDEVIKNKK